MKLQNLGKLSATTIRAARKLICLIAIITIIISTTRAADEPATPAGTVISNRADATYQDNTGATYNTVSQTVMVTVAAVPAVTVTPDESSPSATVAPNERVVRRFQICNTGNATDFYLPTAAAVTAPAQIAEIYFDADNSGTVTSGDVPVQINQTLTPRLAPNACYGVLFVVDTGAVQPQTQLTFNFTARSTLSLPNGSFPQDSGTIINTVGNGVHFTSVDNTALPPQKLVENLPRYVATPGQTLNYKILFRNSGAVTARQVRVVDDLPAELEYVSGTMQLGNRTLTDAADNDEGTATTRRVELLIREIAPNAVTEIRFQARLIGMNSTGSGVVNLATVGAANAVSVNSSEAVAVVNPVGTVYAGNSGGTARVAGARVTVAVDESGTPLALTPNTGYAPNEANNNPFAADARGAFSFVLNENQIGTPTVPVRYFVTATAPNYRPRRLEAQIQAIGGGLFKAAVRALDNQPVAVANGFALTSDTVLLNNLAALVFNIPMFELSTLEISKNADKQFAEIGDIVSYRVQVRNATASVMRETVVRDTLPASFVYAPDSAQIEIGGTVRSIPAEQRGSDIFFTVGDLAAGASATISYRVRVGANAREGEQFNLAVATGRQPNGDLISTQPVRAGVKIRAGVFSQQQIVVGRVFEDRDGNGKFDEGERPVAGARIYLNNGQSVITDSAGQYNLPAVSGGSIVLSLDPVTLPAGYQLLNDDGRRSSASWTRLLRTPLGGGSLLRQNFAIAPKDSAAAVPENVKVITADNNFVLDSAKPESKPAAPQSAPGQNADLNGKVAVGKPVNFEKSKTSEQASDEQRQIGTFTVEATETIVPVEPGKIMILSPKADEVVMSPALTINARVAKDWTLQAEVNGERVSASSIGEARVDNRNNVATFSFVGINLRAGANSVRLTAVGANGERGSTEEIKVWGRGSAVRLEVVPAKTEVQAGGREAVKVEIRAFDEWGHPAADGQVAIETSAGRIIAPQNTNHAATETEKGKFSTNRNNVNDVENNQQAVSAARHRQQTVSLVGGVATVQLVGDASAETANLKAVAGRNEAKTQIRFTPELRPTLLVGLAELSIGRAAPEISATGDEANMRARIAFYYRGRLFNTNNLLTLAYDSNKALNRIAGRDRFGEFDPLDRAYPLFGDSSLRFEDAQSNSKLYARLDRGRSYAMFGDMEAGMENLALTGYSRRLTGVKLHLENSRGDFISVTGARPDTAFARDVIPGGSLSLVRLSHGEILPGSEMVWLEVRDRRNPEIILEREQLIRSVDYNLNPLNGEIFFLRPISTFDYRLNLVQIVVAYEHRGADSSNYVYTGRGSRRFDNFGLRLGASYVNQQQSEIGAFHLGGFDLEKTLPRKGKLTFEAGLSRGRFASGVNVFDFYNNGFGNISTAEDTSRERNGTAFRIALDQPLAFYQSRLRAGFQRSSADYYNPFGATVAPGAQRLNVEFDLRPATRRALTFGFMDERNRTANVANSRQTFSVLWSEQWRENLRTVFGFDRRRYHDDLTDRTIDSNLVTAGVEYRPTNKLELSVKREQNLTDADPTYPDQTTISASYALDQNTKLFATQRLASAPITPIGDLSNTGFASTGARRETAFGIETKLSRLGLLNGRYQLENGINGTDSFAVIGLQNRFALNKEISLDGGFERGFLLAGQGKSFNRASLGATWTPGDGFRSSARYELRDRNGFGQLLTVSAAGRIGYNWTTLARAQFAEGKFNRRASSSSNVTGAFAFRPLDSDRYALLFSYNHRSLSQDAAIINNIRQARVRDRADTLSSDGLYQVNRDLEVYGRFALRFNGSGDNANAYASALTYLGQLRAQQRFGDYFDFAAEGRWLAQPDTRTARKSFGGELGFWALPDLRLGGGYNFTDANDSTDLRFGGRQMSRGGFYFTITSKLSNLFDLFGTSSKGLEQTQPSEQNQTANNR